MLLVGTNRVLCFAALQGISWDALVLRDTYRNLWHDQRWGAKYHDELWKSARAWKVGPADRRVTHCDEFVRQADGWQFERRTDANGEAAVMRNASVVLTAYFPCAATFFVLFRELGVRDALKSAAIMLGVAFSVGGLLNVIMTGLGF